MKNIIIMNLGNYKEFERTFNKIIGESIGGIAIFIEFKRETFKKLLENKFDFNLDYPLSIKCKKLRKIAKPFNANNKHHHNITGKNLFDGIKNITNPRYIAKTGNNLTFYTSIKDSVNNYMLIGITFNYKHGGLISNNIETVFGYDKDKEKYLEKETFIGKRKIIYTKEKGWLQALDASPSITKD